MIADIKKTDGEIRYWVLKRSTLKVLSRVALWLRSVTVSSASSELDIIFLNKHVTPERNRLKDDIIDDITFDHSYFGLMKRTTGPLDNI